MRYRLTAKLGKATRVVHLYGDVLHSWADPLARRVLGDDLDSHATAVAGWEVLRRAHGDTVWALGAITLYHPDGTVLRTMDAKTDTP